MVQRMLALAATVLLVALPALAADPGAKPAITVGGAVNDVALAWQTGALGVAHQDPGSRASVPPNPTADAWHLYGPSLQEIQSGHADVAACESGALFDDCQTHAQSVVLSQDGSRMVVGSTPDSGNAILTFIREASGDDHRLQLGSGALTDLAMSDNGQTIVATTNQGPGTGNRGHVYLVNWPSGSGSPVVSWTSDLATGPTDVAISPDGNSIVVVEGPRHHHYTRSSAGSRFGENNGGTGNDVAISNGLQRLSVAGWSDGYFLLYNDNTGADRHEFQLRNATSPSAIEAVAIRADGSAIAVGNSAGDLWVYQVDQVLVRAMTPRLGHVSLGSAAQEIAFARDGNSLAVAHGNSVSHFAIDNGRLVKLWSANLTSAAGEIAIDEHGDTVATAAGAQALVYEAVHRVDITVPPLPEAQPGKAVSAVMTFANTGNRIESGTLTVQAPSGWTAVLDRTTLRLNPDGTAAVKVNVTAAPGETPGKKTVAVTSNLGAAGTKITALEFNVPAIEAWRLAAHGPTSLGVQAGGSNSFIVNVTNAGNVAKQPPLEVEVAPSTWTVAAAGNDGALAGGATRQMTITVTAPADAPQLAQGVVTVTLPAATGSPLVLMGTVGASFGASLDGPPGVEATPGQTTRIQFAVKNTGNAPDSYTLTAGALPTGWTMVFPTDAVAVGAGQTATAAVELVVPAGASLAAPVELSVTATSEADPSKTDSHRFLVSLPSDTGTTTSDSGTKTKSKDSPGPAPILAVAVVAVAAWAASRRTR